MTYQFSPDTIVECDECGQEFCPEKGNTVIKGYPEKGNMVIKGYVVCDTCMDIEKREREDDHERE